jgi:hypothetical protein
MSYDILKILFFQYIWLKNVSLQWQTKFLTCCKRRAGHMKGWRFCLCKRSASPLVSLQFVAEATELQFAQLDSQYLRKMIFIDQILHLWMQGIRFMTAQCLHVDNLQDYISPVDHMARFRGEVRTSPEIVLHLPWEFLHLPWKVVHFPLGKFQR